MLIRKGERIPFDVAPNRAILYDTSDWNSPSRCVEELTKQIATVLQNPDSADNPISAAMTFKALTESSDPTKQFAATLVPRLQAVEFSIQGIEAKLDTIMYTQSSSLAFTPPSGGANLSNLPDLPLLKSHLARLRTTVYGQGKGTTIGALMKEADRTLSSEVDTAEDN